MALSDCIKCWQTPCECGYEHQCWEIYLIDHVSIEVSIEAKIKQIEAIMGKDKKEILDKLNQNKDE